MSHHKLHFITIFIISGVLISFEFLLTRIFSVIMWYHFAFLAISLAMFGICIGSVVVSLVTKYRRSINTDSLYTWALFVYPVVILLSSFILFNIPFNPARLVFRNVVYLSIIMVSTLIPFVAGGMIMAILYQNYRRMAGRLYACDLAGAAIACAVMVVLLNYLGAPTALLLISSAAIMVLVINNLVFKKKRTLTLVSIIMFLTALFLTFTNHHYHWLSVKYTKGNKESGLLFSAWNSMSRVCVYDPDLRRSKPVTPGKIRKRVVKTVPESTQEKKFAITQKSHGRLPAKLELVIDSSAGTYLRPWKGDLAELNNLVNPLFSLVYRIRSPNKVVIIGPGGGQDIISALAYNAGEVTAVEINPLVVKAVNEIFGEYTGYIYSMPGVTSVIDDGRHYIRVSHKKYDVTQATLIDTWAATAAGAYALSENNLYTVEAFEEYLEHLVPGGMISFSRFYFDPPRQSLRLVSIAREALHNQGINPAAHSVIVAREGIVSTVIVKKGAFTAQEIQKCRDEVDRCKGETVYYPGQSTTNYFSELLSVDDPEKFYASYPFDVHPPTDNRPFFFHLAKPGDWLRFRNPGGQKHLYQASHVLALLFIFALVLSVVVYSGSLIPEFCAPSRTAGAASQMAYFACIGIGFIMTEIILIQKMTLFLGHPVYSISVILFSFLLFSGIGAFFSHRNQTISGRFAVLVALILVGAYLLPVLINHCIGYPRPLKILLSLAILFPFGFMMGKPFPHGLRMIGDDNRGKVPFAYAVNGAFSVLGSVTAMILGICLGFTWVMILAAIMYAGAWLFSIRFSAIIGQENNA